MQIFRHFTANSVKLKNFPFERELNMEAYLVENSKILCLDDDIFSDVEIIETELTLKQGRARKDTDGRIDILATYEEEEYIAVIELKLGALNEEHLNQLKDYLKTKDQILSEYENDLKDFKSPKWIGILVGESIKPDLASKILNGNKDSDVQIAALTIQRYRGEDGNIYVTTDTYFKSSSKDYSKYDFNNKLLNKRKLVLEVIKKHVEMNKDISYSSLERDFPKKLQGSCGVFNKWETVNEKGRHFFLQPEELIKLSDGSTIAVCNQWGIGNIENFIDAAKKLGHKILSNR